MGRESEKVGRWWPKFNQNFESYSTKLWIIKSEVSISDAFDGEQLLISAKLKEKWHFFSFHFTFNFLSFFRGTVKWKFVPWNPGLMLTGILSNNSRQEFLFDTTLITLPHSTNNATKQDLRQKTLFRSIEFLKSQINKTQLSFFSQLSLLLFFFASSIQTS